MGAGHDWSPDTRLQGCAGSLVAEIDFKMGAGHDWSPDTRLNGCAGSLVADM